MVKQYYKRIIVVVLTLVPLLTGRGLGGVVLAQEVSDLARSNPLIMTGAMASQNTYSHSTVGDG